MSERQMQDGVWYDLNPPAVVIGKRGQGTRTFRHVLCEYQVPSNPNEYSVRGIPDGGTKEEPFIVTFIPNEKIKATPSQKQTA